MNPEKLHILIIPSWYPSEKNPYNGNFVKRHAELIATKHQVTVLNFETAKIQKSLIQFSENNNLVEITIQYPKRTFFLLKWLEARRAFRIVSKSISSVDIIHGHVILEKGWFFLWAKKEYKKPLVVTEHASYLFRAKFEELGLMQKNLISKVFNRADAISLVSPVLKKELSILFPQLKPEITPNFINGELFFPETKTPAEKCRFIHVSTLEKVKNIKGILEAFKMLKGKSGEIFHFQIIAENKNPEIEKLILESGLSACVSMKGPVPIEEVATEMKKADALILFSEYETFSCVVAEAWSCGIPVISTSVGIATEMPEYLGKNVKQGDVDELATCIRQFIEQARQYDAEQIRKYAAAYSAPAVLASFDKIYTSLV